jgi:hypothetical protein
VFPQGTLSATRFAGGGVGVTGLFSSSDNQYLTVRAEVSQVLGDHSRAFVRVEFLRPSIDPTSLADNGSQPPTDVLPHYAAHVDMVPLSAGVAFGSSTAPVGPFLEFCPSVVWSRWNYDDEFFSVLSYVRLLLGYQVSAGVRVKASDRARLSIRATKYWTESSTSEELDSFGAWTYPGFRQVGLSLGLEWRL